MSNYQLAQLNIGEIRAPLDSPELKDFVDNLDPINALAESSPGYVWRLKGDGNDATSLRPYDSDKIIVNMSVWRDVASLRAFVYDTAHVAIMKRRREFFMRMIKAYMVLWWVPVGHEPTVAEAVAKLEHLRAQGPTAEAFTFAEAFSAPDAVTASAPFSFKDSCPA
ncbi:MAG: DUF3291 domain-containing protein [Steroidobacteraceae bacterium]|nr:DUF3291 domain-containing protein [Steroidobacteraceae bacterium]